MMDLFKAIGLGLVVLLPLANPLTTVALFLGLAGNMNSAERNRQSLMASVYVFAIMMVAYYAGQLVMNTFGISIPGGEKQVRGAGRRTDCQHCICTAGNAKHRRSGYDSNDHQLGVNRPSWLRIS